MGNGCKERISKRDRKETCREKRNNIDENETSCGRNPLRHLRDSIAHCEQMTHVVHGGKLEKRTERIAFEATTIETGALG
ncbi:hypothetical protein MTO96_028970 [Rhipicephalus appendiculatus]